jgi:hypothetical protein
MRDGKLREKPFGSSLGHCSRSQEGVSSPMPTPTPWAKYNPSRRPAGNRDLCQPLAGARGKKVSVIGRVAGRQAARLVSCECPVAQPEGGAVSSKDSWVPGLPWPMPHV